MLIIDFARLGLLRYQNGQGKLAILVAGEDVVGVEIGTQDQTAILHGEHISIDAAVCARCGKPRELLDSVADTSAIAAVGVSCAACDAVTVLRCVVDPFISSASE